MYIESYVNDNMDSATICKDDNGDIIVRTDLSAHEKKYASIKAARHDLSVCGYYKSEK